MTTNISKIKDERLTEDEKMEIIADYLESGGGDNATLTIKTDDDTYTYDGKSDVTVKLRTPALLYINNMWDLVNYTAYGSDPHIYSDPLLEESLTWDEFFKIALDLGDNRSNLMPPREVWFFETNSADGVYKVVGGTYQDSVSGVFVFGPECISDRTKPAFYRIFADPDGGDNTVFMAEQTNIAS